MEVAWVWKKMTRAASSGWGSRGCWRSRGCCHRSPCRAVGDALLMTIISVPFSSHTTRPHQLIRQEGRTRVKTAGEMWDMHSSCSPPPTMLHFQPVSVPCHTNYYEPSPDFFDALKCLWVLMSLVFEMVLQDS